MTRHSDFIAALEAEAKDPVKSYRNAISDALPSNYYQGTVPEKTIAKRRAHNKAARASRKRNRR